MYIDKKRLPWDFNSISVVVILGLIFFAEYYIFMFVFIKKLFAITIELAIFIALDMHLCIVMMIWSYSKVASTGPGYLTPAINEHFPNIEQIKARQKQVLKYKFTKKNPGATVDDKSQDNLVNDPEAIGNLEKLKKIAEDPILQLPEIGFCFKCNIVKIPRSHHCRQCGKCVLRMDHHCPWIGNCVGYYNHKFFNIFLVYAAICLYQVFITELFFFFFNLWDFCKGMEAMDGTLLQINSMTSLALAAAVTFLGSFHVYMARNNVTTVEYHIKDIIQRNPFNKGVSKNLEEVFGVDRTTWILPITPRLRKEDELFLLHELE